MSQKDKIWCWLGGAVLAFYLIAGLFDKPWRGDHVNADLPAVPVYLTADRVGRAPSDFYERPDAAIEIIEFGPFRCHVRFEDGREGWLPTEFVK